MSTGWQSAGSGQARMAWPPDAGAAAATASAATRASSAGYDASGPAMPTVLTPPRKRLAGYGLLHARQVLWTGGLTTHGRMRRVTRRRPPFPPCGFGDHRFHHPRHLLPRATSFPQGPAPSDKSGAAVTRAWEDRLDIILPYGVWRPSRRWRRPAVRRPAPPVWRWWAACRPSRESPAWVRCRM